MNRTAILFVLLTVTCVSAYAETARQLSDAQWIEDIDAYVENVRTIHLNPFNTISEEAFVAEVDSLKAEVPALTDFAIMLRIRRLASLIGDGHTWIRYGKTLAPRRLPVQFKEFADGVFVIGGMSDASQYRGGKLESIGGMPVAELLDRAGAYVSSDNEWGRYYYRLEMLNDEAFLREFGLVTADDTVNLDLTRDGNSTVVQIPLISDSEHRAWGEDASNFVDDDAPLYRSRPDEVYWMEWLPEHKTLYVQFNKVQNREGGPHFVGFGQEVIAAVEEHRARKLIIDLRHNGGGNGMLLNPTIRRIAENKRINREGRLFVLTSSKTFSAALMFTVRMERNTKALFAGTPGGGKPNSYGEFNAVTLPHSGMSGSISSRWHEEGTPDDARDCVPVDIPVALTSTEYFDNRDPGLKAVLAY